ncbi:Lipid-binding SYLF domain-containing protein [Verrucomicrobium sp. GAS474]|nr:Lipid-binding SYLF domain-containing protein [Verrucomicrobium sp. GAS474]
MAFLFSQTAFVQAADMKERIQSAIQILDQKQDSADPIPASLYAHAKGVAIFTVTKAGLGIGGLGGEGIVVARLGDMKLRSWTAPSAFNVSGASIGAQIGFTEARYIVILNTDHAVRQFTSHGKTRLNATASGTAGSDTATAKASTADLEKTEIVVYKDSAGVFGGATLGGTSIERKNSINRAAYGNDVRIKDILNGTIKSPASTDRLYLLLDGKA